MSRNRPDQAKAANTLLEDEQRGVIDLCQQGPITKLAKEVAQNVSGQVNGAAPQRRVNLVVSLAVDKWSSSNLVRLENVKISESGLPDVTNWICVLSGFDRTQAYIGLGAQAFDAGKIGVHTVTLSVSVEVCND